MTEIYTCTSKKLRNDLNGIYPLFTCIFVYDVFFRSGLDTEKETFNILSPSQNPLPNGILLILDLQFMDIEI